MSESSQAEPSSDKQSLLSLMLKRYALVAVPVLIWLSVGELGFVDRMAFENSMLIVSVLLFAVGIPLSLFLQLHNLTYSFGITSNSMAMLLALAIVFGNFLLFTLLIHFYRRLVSPETEETSSEP